MVEVVFIVLVGYLDYMVSSWMLFPRFFALFFGFQLLREVFEGMSRRLSSSFYGLRVACGMGAGRRDHVITSIMR